MSGEAAKEHVTAVLSKSKLPTYFRCVDVSAYVCGLSKQRNRRRVPASRLFEANHFLSHSLTIAWPYCHRCGLCVTSHLAIAEHVRFCVISDA